MRLVLIDNRIREIENITGALTADTEYQVFDFYTDTISSIRDKIVDNYESVAIIQHNYNLPTYQLVSDCSESTIFDMKNVDPELDTWRDYIDFLVWLKEERGIGFVDLLACDLWADENWRYMIEKVRERDGVYIRASLDITGAGGDFVLESDDVDLIGIYFTEGILDYKYAFYLSSNIQTVADTFSPIILPYTNVGTVSSTLSGAWSAPSSIPQYSVVSATAHFSGYTLLLSDKTVYWKNTHSFSTNPTAAQYLQLVNVSKLVSVTCATAALKEDGTVVCWCRTANAQQDITTSTATNVPYTTTFALTVTNIISLVASQGAFLALSSTGRIYVWGATDLGASLITTSINNIVRIDYTRDGFYVWNNTGTCSQWNSTSTTLTPITGTVIDIYRGLAGHSKTLYLKNINGSKTITTLDSTPIYQLSENVEVLKYVSTINSDRVFFLLNTQTVVDFSFNPIPVKSEHYNIIDLVANSGAAAMIQNDTLGNRIITVGDVNAGGKIDDTSYGLPTQADITNPIKLFSTASNFGVLTSLGKFYIWGNMKNFSGGFSTTFITNNGPTNDIINTTSNNINVYDTFARYIINKSNGTYVVITFPSADVFDSGKYINTYTKPANTGLGILTAQTYVVNGQHQSLIPVFVPIRPRVVFPGFIFAEKTSTVSYYISNPELMAYAGRVYTLYYDTTLLSTLYTTTTSLTYSFSNVKLPSPGNYTLTIKDNTNTRAVFTIATFTLPVYNYNYLYTLAGTVSTTSGTATTNVSLESTLFNNPGKIAFDSLNNMYIADTNNHVIRVVPSHNGSLYGVNVTVGNTYIVAGTANTSGTVITNGVSNLSCQLNYPYGIAFDSDDNMFISDTNNHVVRAIAKTNTMIYGVNTTANTSCVVAGTGVAGSTSQTVTIKSLNNVGNFVSSTLASGAYEVQVTDDDLRLITTYYFQSNKQCTYKLRTSTSTNWNTITETVIPFVDTISTTYAAFASITPDGKTIALQLKGFNYYYSTWNDASYNKFKLISALGVGTGSSVRITADGNRIVIVRSSTNIRFVTWDGNNYTGATDVTVGSGIYEGSKFGLSRDGNRFVARSSANQVILYQWGTVTYGTTATIIDSTSRNYEGFTFSPDGNILLACVANNVNGTIYKTTWGTTNYSAFTSITTDTNRMPTSIDAISIHAIRNVTGAKLYTFRNSGLVLYENTIFYNIETIPAPTAYKLNFPSGIAIDACNNLYIANTRNSIINVISRTDGVLLYGISAIVNNIYTLIGTAGTNGSSIDGVGVFLNNTLLNYPYDIAFDTSYNLYVSDTSNNIVRVVSNVSGTILGKSVLPNRMYIVAGTSSTTVTSGFGSNISATDASVQLYSPRGLALDASNSLYISDSGSHTIRAVSNINGKIGSTSVIKNNIYTVIGTLNTEFVNGNPTTDILNTSSTLKSPYNITTYNTNIYISDSGTNSIRLPILYKSTSVSDPPIINSLIAGNTTLTLSFSAPADNGGNPITAYYYSLKDDINPQSSYTSIGSSPQSSFPINFLKNGNTYTLSLIAQNALGNSTAANATAVPYTFPSTPNLTFISGGNGSLTVTLSTGVFNGGNAYTTYFYSTNNGGSYTSTSGNISNPYTITTNLINGTPYDVKFITQNAAGNSSPSNTLTAIPYTTPSKPIIDSIVGGNTSLTVSLNTGVFNGGNAYTTYYYSVDGISYTSTSGNITNPYIITTGLQNGNTYPVSFITQNAAGNSVASDPVSGIPYTVPNKPTITSLVGGNTTLDMYFTPPTDTGGNAITTYYYSTNNGNTYTNINGITSPYTIPNLTNGNSFSVILLATNYAGNSVASDPDSGIPYTFPNKPTITSLVGGDSTLTMNFTAPTDTGGNAITAYYYSLNSGTYVSIGGITSPYIIPDLSNGVSYTVLLRAENAAGNSNASDPLSGIPYTTPSTPDLTNIVSGNNTITVTLNSGVFNGGNAYTTYFYSTNNGGSYTSTSGNITNPYTITTNLINGTSYDVKFITQNAAGNSSPSNTLSAIPYTVPNTPVITSVNSGNNALTVLLDPSVSDGGNAITTYYYNVVKEIDGYTYYRIKIISLVESAYTSGFTSRGAELFDLLENSLKTSYVGYKFGSSNTGNIATFFTSPGANNDVRLPANLPVYIYFKFNTPIKLKKAALYSAGSAVSASNANKWELYGSNTLSAYDNGDSAVVNWTLLGTVNTSTYNPAYLPITSNSNTYTYTGVNLLPSYTINGLLNGSIYSINVVSKNIAGNSSPSLTSSGIPFTVPDVPILNDLVSGNTKLTANVSAPAWQGGNAITKYYYTLDNGITYYYLGNAGQSQYDISGLENGNSYTVSIIVENYAGNSQLSANLSAIPFTVPEPPTLDLLIGGNAKLTANVIAPAQTGGNAVTTYYYNLNGSTTYYYLGPVEAGPYDISGVNNGNSYTVTITVKNAAGNSSPSSGLTSIPYTVPDMPIITALIPGNTILTANVSAESWNGGNTITKYYYTLDDGVTYFDLGTGGQPQYTISNLDNGNSYTVAIKAENYAGNSQLSANLSAIPYTVPDAPTLDLLISGNAKLTANVIAPAWNGGNAITTYYYNLDGSTNYFYLGPVGQPQYDISGLENGIPYTISIIVENAAGNSQLSNLLSQIPYTVPDAPTVDFLISGNRTLTANVIAPQQNGGASISTYYYTLNGGVTYNVLSQNGLLGYRITDLENGNSYTVAIKAENAAGNSQLSANITAIPYTVPDAPTFDILVSGNVKLTANVIVPAQTGGNAITNYYYNLNGSSTFFYLGPVGQPQYDISGVENGRSYTVAIKAENAAGNSIQSFSLTATPYTVPDAPTFDILVSGNAKLTANVIAPAQTGGNAVRTYYYNLNGSATYYYLGPVGQPQYDISGLDNGNSYTVAVRVDNAAGNSSPSSSLTAIPYTVPDVPTITALISGNTTLTANVTAPAWNGGNAITNYYYTLDSGTTYFYLGLVGQPQYTITGLDNGNSYAVAIIVENAAGNSQLSANLSAIPFTIPEPPTLNLLIGGNAKLTANVIAPAQTGGNAITTYYYNLDGSSTYYYLGPVGQPQYDISGLDNGNSYTVSVRAENTAGNSNPSSSLSAIPYTIPDVPTLDLLIGGNTTLTANVIAPTWNGGNAITKYYYTLDSGATYFYLGPVGEPQYTITGLDNGNSYAVSIVVENTAGNSQLSANLTAIPYTIPDAPTLDLLIGGNTKLTANVIAPAWNGGNAITNYYYNLDGSSIYYYLGPVGQPQYDISGLNNGNSYTVSVRVENTAGNSQASATKTGIPYTIPNQPVLSSIASGDRFIMLNITEPTWNGGNAITKYYYTFNNGVSYSYLGVIGLDEYYITNLDNGNSYTVEVIVENTAGNSQLSNSLTGIPFTVPDAPTLNSLISGNAILTADVSAPTWNGGNAITSYYYSIDQGDSYLYLGAYGTNTYTITGLENGLSYEVLITANNTAGNSAASNRLSAIPITTPDVPSLTSLIGGNTTLTATVVRPQSEGGNPIKRYYYTINGSAYIYLGNASVGTYTISDLTNGNSYTISVIGENDTGNSNPSNSLTAIPYTIPDVPTLDFLISGNTTLTANVIAPTWNGGNAITGYYYNLNASETYYYLGNVNANPYTITGLDNGNSYAVSITAKNTAGNSSPSNSLSAIPYTVPNAPRIDGLVSGNTTLTATIIAPIWDGGNAITKYYYTLNNGLSYTYLGLTGQPPYVITDLSNGTEYNVAVIVENIAGNSRPSTSISGIPYTVPDAPTLNNLVSRNNSLIATITDGLWNGGTEISSYYYTLDGGSTYSYLGGVGDIEYTISNVDNGNSYTVEVVSQNAAGNSAKSNALSAIPYTVPDSPTLDVLISGNTKLTANIIAPAQTGGNAITTYYYNLNGSATYYYLGPVGQAQYDISGLDNGNSYTVSVQVKNTAGNSNPSSSLTAIPYTIPDVPTLDLLISGNTTLTANVIAPAWNGGNAITNYYYTLDSGATYSFLGQAGQPQYTITGLDNGNSYTVAIIVENTAGNSNPSSSLSAIPYTIPDVPTLDVLISGNTTLTANVIAPTWNGGNAITNYYYTLDSGATYSFLGQAGQPQYTITGLENGNSYTVAIIVENTAGNSQLSANRTAIPYTIPDVPTLDILVSGNTKLTANVIAPAWNGGNAITTYYYNLNGSATYYYLGPVGQPQYDISGLANGNSYTVSVRVENTAGNSQSSTSLTAIPYTVPDVPTITALISGNTTLTANVTAPAWNGGNAITTYYYTLDSGTTYFYLGMVGQPQYTITGLENGNSYTVAIVVENIAGNSQLSTNITAIPYTIPDSPTLDVLVSGNTTLTANVTAPAWNGGNVITTYYYNLNGSATYYYLGPVGEPQYTITGLDNGNTYTVSVIVKNTAGNSQPSNSLSKIPYTVPNSPFIDRITSRNASLNANVIAPAWNGGNAIVTYYYTINGGLTYRYLGLVGESSYTITGLVNGTTYDIEVVVDNIAGNSSPSNTVSAIPFTVPGRPTLDYLIGGNTTLTANVILPAQTGGNAVTEYYYNLNGSSTYFYLGEVGSGPYVIPGLNNGNSYTVSVRAKNVAGNSQPSTSRNAIPYTIPDSPTFDLLVSGNAKLTANVIEPAWNGGNAIISYYYNLNGSATYSYLGAAGAGPYDITGLDNGNAYIVSIKAQNTAGNSQSSTTLTAIPYTIPDAPSISAIFSGDRTLTANVTAPAWNGGNAITTYYYTLDSGATYFYLGTVGQPQYTIIGLDNGQSYTVSVIAENIAGNSQLSANRTAIPYTIPDSPTLDLLISGNTKLTANVIAPTQTGGNAITTYYYNLNGSATYYYLGPVGQPQYDISGLNNGNAYTVSVQVENTAGNSSPSTAKTAIPYTVPDKPTIDLLSSGDEILTAYISAPIWNGGNAIIKYYYTLNSGVSYSYLGVAGQSSYTITGLTNGNTYTVAVIAENYAGNSIASDPSQAASYTVPDPPTIDGLISGNTTLTANVIVPTWNGGTAVTEYYYTVDSGITYFYLGPVGQSQYVIPNLINGTQYDVSIRAKNIAGNSNISNVVSAIPYRTPDAPVLTSLVSGNTTLTMNFNQPVSDGGNAIINYNFSLDGIIYTSIDSISPQYTITNLENGNTYTVRVRAENTAGNSSASNTLSAIPYTVPDSPILQTLTPGVETIDVSFSAPAWNGGNAITAYYYSVNGGLYRSIEQLTSPYTITGLTNGILYGVTFIAQNARGNSQASDVLYARPYRIPDPPRQLLLTPGVGSITLNFTPPIFNGGNAIVDYQYSINDSSYVRMGQQTNTPYVISQLTNGITYTVYLQAINDRGNSIASVPATTTPYSGPDAPVLLAAISGDTTVDISFSVPTFNGGSAITNYLFSLDGSNGTFFSMSQTTNEIYRVSPLNNGTSYLVSVKAVNARGQSNASNEIAVTPYALPDPPTLDYIVDGVGSSSVYFVNPISDGGNAINNYRYSLDGGNTFIAFSPAQITSPVIITSLQNAETYSVCLQSVNARGNSASSNVISTTPYRVPDAPTITSVRPDIGEATVFFTAPTFSGGRPITNYRYSINGQATFIDFSPATTTSPYTITGLTNGQSYTVYLEAINLRGNSTVSNAITTIPYDVPNPPIVNTVIPGIGSIDVSFSSPIDTGGNAITSYYYSIDQGNLFVSVGATPTQFTIPSLTNGVSYDVIMKAENARGNSNVWATQTTIPYSVPDAPRQLVLTPGIGSISASFLAPTFNGGNAITNYYYSITSNVYVPITQSPFVIPDLEDGTVYTVSVVAENARGNSASITTQTIPYRVPNPPSISSLFAGDTYIDIFFSAPVFDGGNAIINYQYATSDNSLNYIAFNPTQTTSPYRVSNLENGRTYTFMLQAINARGSSATSNNLTTKPYTVPNTPILTQLVAGNSYIDVYFSPPTFDGGNPITDYTYSLNGATHVSMGGITVPYRILGLNNGQTYTVSVKATNARGSSIITSNERSATPYTMSNPPTIRRLTAGINAIDVSFSAPTFDGGSPIIDYQYSLNSGPLVSIGATVDIFTIPDLSNGVSYSIRMVAININGASELSSQLTTTPFDIPDPPTISELIPGNRTIDISFSTPLWNGGSAITNYQYSINDSSFISMNSLISPYTITDLSNGELYRISMISVNARGTSLFSNILSATPRTVPDTPTIVTITPGDHTIEVLFSPPAWNGGSPITSYKYLLNSTVYVVNSASNIFFTIPDLENGERYYIALIAVNAAGESAPTEVRSVIPYGIPTKPEIIGYTPGDSSILLQYSDLVSDGGKPITSYKYSINGSPFIYNVIPVDGTLLIDNLVNGQTYEIRIRAVNEAGISNSSDPFILVVYTVPPPPTIENITPSQLSLTVSIRPPQNNSGSVITGYKYAYEPDGLIYTDVSGLTFTIPGLQGDVEYSVRVKSVNEAGESIASNPYYATPFTPTYNTIPDPPIIEYVQDGSGYSIVYYSLGMDKGSAIRSIYYTISEFAGEVDIVGTPGGEPDSNAVTVDGKIPLYLSFVLNNLVNGVVYEIRMFAENEYGLSLESEVVYSAPYTSPAVPIVTRSLAINNEANIQYEVQDDGGRNITDVFYSVNGAPFLSNGINPNLKLTQLLNKNTYSIRFVAKNQAGLFSPISDVLSVEPHYSAVDLPLIKQSNTINQSLSKKGQYALTVRINRGNRRFIG